MANSGKVKPGEQTKSQPTIVWEPGQGKKGRGKPERHVRQDSGKTIPNVIPFTPKLKETTFVQLHIPLDSGESPLVITSVSSGFGNVQNLCGLSVLKCAA